MYWIMIVPLFGTPHAWATVVPTGLTIQEKFATDPTCFTQGLVLWGDAFLVSCGRYKSSSVREAEIMSGKVRRERPLDDEYFGEGLELLPDNRLVQLTWQAGKAFEYDFETFDLRQTFNYAGEGWGLCYDSAMKLLVMSDGSSALTFRDAVSFVVQHSVEVTLNGRPVQRLNELECVEGYVYANIWLTDQIMRIDPTTGDVDCVLDAANLLTPNEESAANVLNGIAFDSQTRHFYITGKLWPWVFRVDFGACGPPMLGNDTTSNGHSNNSSRSSISNSGSGANTMQVRARRENRLPSNRTRHKTAAHSVGALTILWLAISVLFSK